ncbi:pullulanase-type alpha-1,6-glucosidase [Sphingomicrobium sp. XHP0235]|uniref:pullulanase-type alpha-1,6-glucosidase n=1 Tax=Sphingomicrobium aquimarinum TaxID=3133971 RepID=UPI0031FF2005
MKRWAPTMLALLLVMTGGCTTPRVAEAPPALGLPQAVILPHPEMAEAHWLAPDLFAWDAPADDVVLVADGQRHTLKSAGELGGDLAASSPHLAGVRLWRAEDIDAPTAARLLRGQAFVEARRGDGSLAATGLQVGAVLDALYADTARDRPLGASVAADGRVTLALWAPTARSVSLQLFDASEGGEVETLDMARDPATGIWIVTGPADWNRRYYLYEVELFVPQTGRIETNHLTDPYSLNLAPDSTRSQIVDLDDPDLKPVGWDDLARDLAETPVDRSVYELHVRDFSMQAEEAASNARGGYLAFADPRLPGSRHLAALARAGLSDVHLLPVNDCATILEKRDDREEPSGLEALPPNSEEQQARIAAVTARDGFNWCYDPWHFLVPEGSYASSPDGTARILEFRQMVMALDAMGLGTVLDVVFNHTTRHGQDAKSVLDRIVPGYYHRLDVQGKVATSTCCSNTATERVMMEKLMLDALETWARDYKVSGFRFDLMGHHSRANILAARDRLSRLTLAENQVDGRDLLIYGEGWNFGEVADDARFVQATQLRMAGTGIGTFNDRFRDALRGGGCCDKGSALAEAQGVATGLHTAPNAVNGGKNTRARALELSDHLRAGLAGSLANFTFATADGSVRAARALDYGGQPVGYTAAPSESVNYAAAHDNPTLFDIGVYKLPRDLTKDERVRWQNMATSFVLLAQGMPFIHAGQDLLRTKSLDHNSYDSGDWFNAIDFSGQRHGWGRGLPPERDNKEDWPEARTLLARDAFAMEPEHIARTAAHLRELFKIRMESGLFRLADAEAVQRNLRFLAAGADQQPGLIAMALGEAGAEQRLVIFNATPERRTIPIADARRWELHPVQRASDDQMLSATAINAGSIEVPGVTTAVFVRR